MSPLLDYERLDFGGANADRLVSWQEHYRLEDERISHGLGASLNGRMSDLIDIAVATYVTDRLRPRKPRGARDDGRHWSRRLPVRVAVRDVAFWTSPDVSGLLHDLLLWLTDDEWALSFTVKHDHGRFSETQTPLFPNALAQPAQAGLLSGGLDSLLGAAADLREDRGELLLISAATNGRLDRLQRRVAAGLARTTQRKVRLLVVPVGLRDAARRLSNDPPEQSQRSRGLLFLAFGGVAADAAGLAELRVYENGVGALNLPQTPAGRGSMNTRAMRPETLKYVEQLLSLARNAPFSIVNPNFWSTKAEMCRSAPESLRDLMSLSVSCDTGLTHRATSVPLCGVCTSCLLRQQALLAGDHRAVVEMDLERMRGNGLAVTQPELAQPGLITMLGQAMTLDDALNNTDPWAALVDRYPELPSARRALECEPSAIVDLLRRYVSDWRRVDAASVRHFLPTVGGVAA